MSATAMDLTDPIAIAQALIACRSVTPADDGALAIVADALGAMGFVTHTLTFSAPGTPDIANVYARLGTASPNLCFAGHTDVVPIGEAAAWSQPPFEARIVDGVLYGRGAVDMKGAIACFLAATQRHLARRAAPPHGSISFLITGDEEGPSINGTAKVLDWMAARGERLDACIVGEPTNPHALGDEIKIGRRGSVNCEITVRGVQGHVAYPAKADNPVPRLIAILHQLASQPIDSGTEHFDASNLEITILDVPNTATNVIPASARAVANVRYNDLHTRAGIEAWVRAQVAAATGGPDHRVTLAFSGTGDVFRTRPGPLVDTLMAAVRDVTGRTAALTTGGGTSDARFIQAYCPVVEFGLVNATIHQVDERIACADLEALTLIYERVLARYFAAD